MALIAKNLDTGAVVADNVAVADTRATRAVGLLSRSGLNPGEALWIVPSRGVHTWWMRFTIDVLALNESGVVVDRVPGLKPWRIRLPRRGTAGVLELPAGCIAATGTELGHRIQLTRPGGFAPPDPPSPSLAGAPMPRSAPAGAPLARLVRFAARLQRVQDSRCEPHNGLTTGSGSQPVSAGGVR